MVRYRRCPLFALSRVAHGASLCRFVGQAIRPTAGARFVLLVALDFFRLLSARPHRSMEPCRPRIVARRPIDRWRAARRKGRKKSVAAI